MSIEGLPPPLLPLPPLFPLLPGCKGEPPLCPLVRFGVMLVMGAGIAGFFGGEPPLCLLVQFGVMLVIGFGIVGFWGATPSSAGLI